MTNNRSIFYKNLTRVLATTFFAGNLFVADKVFGDSKSDPSSYVKEINEIIPIDDYFWGNLNSELKNKIRSKIKNISKPDIDKIYSKIISLDLAKKEDRVQYKAYMAIMATFEEEMLLYWNTMGLEKRSLCQAGKNLIISWGYWVSNPKSFQFVIDKFLKDEEFVPYKKLSSEGMLGKSLRYCDRVMALAQYRIEGTRDWSVHDVVVPLVKIKHRDADLVLFKKWWAENKANLKWSEEKKKFYVDPTQEKGTGILNVKRHRNREQPIKKPSEKEN